MCSSPLQSEIPVNLRHGVYDVCIVSAPEDAEERDKFSKILKKFVRLKDGYEPEIVLVDETSSDDTFIDRVMKIAELAFENSSFVWYFLTENFLQWTKGDLLKDVSLLQALEERKHHVIPVYAEAKHKEIEHPFGLRVFKGIDLFALLKRRSLQVYILLLKLKSIIIFNKLYLIRFKLKYTHTQTHTLTHTLMSQLQLTNICKCKYNIFAYIHFIHACM